MKRIVIYPGKRLSLQRHHHRAEHWHVISGKAVVTRNEEEVPIEKGQAVNIPQGTLHRIMNPGKDDMTFIEIKTGDYLGEDGIKRIEDDFGRI